MKPGKTEGGESLIRPISGKPRVPPREPPRPGRTFAERLSEAMGATGGAGQVNPLPLQGTIGHPAHPWAVKTGAAGGVGWFWIEEAWRREKKNAAAGNSED